MEMPVYLFTGFIESGKTTFIQDALEGSDFNAGERTLLLLCEEGEEDYDPSKFFGKNVYIEVVEKEEDLTPKHLEELQKKHRPERIIVEYNGMWMLDSFYENMPEDWMTYQEMVFVHGPTFIAFNQNMRNLVVDKFKSAEMIVFNRFERSFDQLEFHKIVRAINRKAQIAYEYDQDNVEFDQIKDELPFDIKSPKFTVEDSDFAEWYRDINEETDKYQDKTITVKGRSVTGGDLPEGTFIFGRHVMTCCVEDISFAGLVCKRSKMDDIEHGGWVIITAKIDVRYDDVYGEIGPVLNVVELEHCQEAKPEVATF
ncbi:MAG: GTP-binding protein [Anaerovoracaceae bacterium]